MNDGDVSPERELYALLNLSPQASDEEIRRSYLQWAQIYHPDKHQPSQMKDIATENFQKIREAYEILSNEHKRQIYDIYGMEGLTAGLELGPRLNKPDEIKKELERLKRRKEEEKLATHVRPTGLLLVNLSLPQYMEGHDITKGMVIASDVQSQLSKRVSVSVGGNLAVSGNCGSGNATILLRHQVSTAVSVEIMASAGLRPLIGIQTSRNLSFHSTATSGLAISLKDGSINLTNAWTRQLSEASSGHIQLVLGPESNIAVGWRKKDEKSSAAGELKFGTATFDASAHYAHRFSEVSHGRVAGKIGSSAFEIELGGGRRISEFSTFRMLYSIGIQGISWRFELHRGGQRLIVPVLLSRMINPLFATCALMVPSSLYFLVKNYLVKPYCLRQERQKALEKLAKSYVQVQEARVAALKAQKLLQNVSNRKKNKQLETVGLVITKAFYGNKKAITDGSFREANNDAAPQILDVAVPLNFLVDDSGQLKLHEGISKSGIMGFYDPCPGDTKVLLVEYTYHNSSYKVVVDEYGDLLIPHEAHTT